MISFSMTLFLIPLYIVYITIHLRSLSNNLHAWYSIFKPFYYFIVCFAIIVWWLFRVIRVIDDVCVVIAVVVCIIGLDINIWVTVSEQQLSFITVLMMYVKFYQKSKNRSRIQIPCWSIHHSNNFLPLYYSLWLPLSCRFWK